jgi:redox-sensitive bicupin YhaK (pirin superfamily)
MRLLRQANARGHANHGWLDSFHSFSFAEYYDPRFMGFSALRVINEDRIAPLGGFPTHPHQEMEILTYVLSGTVAHRDSMGNISQVTAGEFQIMSAGTGITHSEYNPSATEELHLYQIWIRPDQARVAPRYEQRQFPRQEGFQLLLSPDGEEGSLHVYQDMRLWRWSSSVEGGRSASYPVGERAIWLQVSRGRVEVDGIVLEAGDAMALKDEPELVLSATSEAEVLLFDLP